MPTIEQRLKEDIKAALKAGAKADLEVLRMVMSDARYAVIAGGGEEGIPDEVMLKVLQRAVKTRTESAEAYAKGGRQDLVDHERFQIDVVRRYLPAAPSEAEVAAVVDAVIREQGAQDKSATGRVIKAAMARLKGAAEGSVVARLVAARLP